VGLEDQNNPSNLTYELQQNYPNPFNAGTLIRFTLAKKIKVSLEIYNVLGQRVMSVYQGQELNAGEHKVQIQKNDLSSGIYFYRLQADNFIDTKKMIILR
jgi:hypothetical protein